MVKTNKTLPLLKTNSNNIASGAIVVGDPRRAAAVAELLTDVELVGSNREYDTYTGLFSNKLITISSHGVGGAGASICFDELIQGGVKTIIRAGTCGALREDIEDGDIIISTGAIREDGTSDKLVPMQYPAIASRHVISALEGAAALKTKRFHEGIILTQGHFYKGLIPSTLDIWLRKEIDVCAVEMELATLLIIASLHGVHAGGIFTSDGNLSVESDPLTYDPHRDVVKNGVHMMLKIALEALVKMI